jgi:hypothetical protein
MPFQTCPQCEAWTPRLLDNVSKGAWVKYFRCPSCGHVWTTPRDGSRVKLKDVTTALRKFN